MYIQKSDEFAIWGGVKKYLLQNYRLHSVTLAETFPVGL